ncbi:hypothetical protein tinsulaeT_29090 [Thalassotalea insulae]|uniref:Toxin co-regulated pilus biosynthesis protein Q C-terminal domain-containing protein n=1 Tax=Thalassotalea insulae TaxID=2056778 RepID=A0ABQ6GWJ1_9GAMM|nr:TcpQ domain-containing protein [Thalassotalea insulae]GLX79569.1 hypothetical protein tinsulaeT_29090 [Thalassotalea insulae]
MLFWIKNILFLIVLIALAYYLIANEKELFAPSTQEQVIEAPLEEGAVATTGTQPAVKINQKNKAAEGLSRFYANLHGVENEKGPRVRNNIVYLDEPKGDLAEILEAKRLTTRPLRRNWKGSKENRPFRRGQTLHQKLYEYAKNDGLEVIWWLDRDFMVKDPFRIDKDIIATAYQVGQAIGGHFQDGLSTYFCYQQRAIVLIEKDLPYLDEECLLLPISKRH